MPQLASVKSCTGCLACVDACQHEAIKVEEKWGLLYPKIDSLKCVDCKLCEKVCSAIHPVSFDSNLKDERAKAVWSTDERVCMNSASGGFCTAMSLDFIKKGGEVAICIWKDGKAKFVITNKEEEVIAAANSKYVQSDASGIYKIIRDKLKSGVRFLFIGLPCQVVGLYKFLSGQKFENLFTIELICSAAPSIDAVRMQEKTVKGSHLIQFRKKTASSGWGKNYSILLEQNNKEIIIEQSDYRHVFYKIMDSLLTARFSCLNCSFANPIRVADYTAGDFHGNDDFPRQQHNGISLVICKNKRAEDLLKTIDDLEVHDSTLMKAIQSNPRLYNGKSTMLYHPANVFRKEFNKLPLNFRMNFYYNRWPYKALWAFYKVVDKMIILFKYNRIKTLLSQ